MAALGPVFGRSRERGIFKTSDGGKTWRKTLYVSDIAGAADIVFEPGHADTIYASTWEAWRRPWTMNSGGPGSKLWKSTDGGENWTELTGNTGLPKGTWGKVGIAISTPYDNRVVENLKTHEMAVRSAVLLALGETAEDEVFTADGKKKLQKRLTAAINAVLKEKEGFGGIGNVYFTNFIVQ